MIVFNGCSFVWGDELPGYDNDPPSHTELTFAHKLAQKFGETYINLATCGGGNDKIFRDTVTYLQKAAARDEIPNKVVILWSAWQRLEVAETMPPEREATMSLTRYQNMTQVSPYRLDALTKHNRPHYQYFYENMSNYRTDVIHGLTKMCAMQLICDGYGIDLIQGTFHSRAWNNVLAILHPKHRESGWGPFMDHIKECLDILRPECRIGMGNGPDFFEYAKSNHGLCQYGHPNASAHHGYADHLYDVWQKAYNSQITE